MMNDIFLLFLEGEGMCGDIKLWSDARFEVVLPTAHSEMKFDRSAPLHSHRN